ncbi:hypothetical protein L596_017991 [Steinernema carpocapsae]|uniref:Uncharacterized protein n=1 Tax=Steinernema carpocapsae TaxID=34508 RepID=A0A4V6A1W1_STECR|nr:hypothetical protein L596_017991 [Steinernema carpocapsae]
MNNGPQASTNWTTPDYDENGGFVPTMSMIWVTIVFFVLIVGLLISCSAAIVFTRWSYKRQAKRRLQQEREKNRRMEDRLASEQARVKDKMRELKEREFDMKVQQQNLQLQAEMNAAAPFPEPKTVIIPAPSAQPPPPVNVYIPPQYAYQTAPALPSQQPSPTDVYHNWEQPRVHRSPGRYIKIPVEDLQKLKFGDDFLRNPRQSPCADVESPAPRRKRSVSVSNQTDESSFVPVAVSRVLPLSTWRATSSPSIMSVGTSSAPTSTTATSTVPTSTGQRTPSTTSTLHSPAETSSSVTSVPRTPRKPVLTTSGSCDSITVSMSSVMVDMTPPKPKSKSAERLRSPIRFVNPKIRLREPEVTKPKYGSPVNLVDPKIIVKTPKKRERVDVHPGDVGEMLNNLATQKTTQDPRKPNQRFELVPVNSSDKSSLRSIPSIPTTTLVTVTPKTSSPETKSTTPATTDTLDDPRFKCTLFHIPPEDNPILSANPYWRSQCNRQMEIDRLKSPTTGKLRQITVKAKEDTTWFPPTNCDRFNWKTKPMDLSYPKYATVPHKTPSTTRSGRAGFKSASSEKAPKLVQPTSFDLPQRHKAENVNLL